jgi:hypothetical protein
MSSRHDKHSIRRIASSNCGLLTSRFDTIRTIRDWNKSWYHRRYSLQPDKQKTLEQDHPQAGQYLGINDRSYATRFDSFSFLQNGYPTTMCHYNQSSWPSCGHIESRTYNQCEGARERGQLCGERYWRVVQSTSKTKDCPQCAAEKKADKSGEGMRKDVRSLWGV